MTFAVVPAAAAELCLVAGLLVRGGRDVAEDRPVPAVGAAA